MTLATSLLAPAVSVNGGYVRCRLAEDRASDNVAGKARPDEASQVPPCCRRPDTVVGALPPAPITLLLTPQEPSGKHGFDDW